MTDLFETERLQTMDRILAIVQSRLDAEAPPKIVLDLRVISPATAGQSAAREAWSLLAQGLRHLKDGGPQGQQGLITEALSKASLRNTALSASLGIRQPKFTQMLFSVPFRSGFETALFYSRRLIEAAEGDIGKSRQIIQQKIYAEDTARLFMPMDDVLAAAFTAADKQAPVSKETLTQLRRQMIVSFNVVSDKYTEACQILRDALRGLPPPRPGQRPRRGFDV